MNVGGILMKKRKLGHSDLYLSEVSLGCMNLGTDISKATAIIDRALDSGINFLDTADLYDRGENEKIVGKALKGRRDQVIVATKVGNRWEEGRDGWYWDPSKKYIKEEAKQSLQRLGIDYIDLYQLHGGTIEDPIEETIEAFEELKQEGYIRYYGISSIRPNVIRRFVEESSITSVMMQYSLLDRRPEEEMLDFLYKHEVGVLARGPLAKGMLSAAGSLKIQDKGKDGYLDYSYDDLVTMSEQLHDFATATRNMNALALQYVLKHPALTSAVFGASTIDQLEENLGFVNSETIDEEAFQKLKRITKPIIYKQHR